MLNEQEFRKYRADLIFHTASPELQRKILSINMEMHNQDPKLIEIRIEVEEPSWLHSIQGHYHFLGYGTNIDSMNSIIISWDNKWK